MSAFTDWRDGITEKVKTTLFGSPPTANPVSEKSGGTDFLGTYKMPLIIVGVLVALYFIIKKG